MTQEPGLLMRDLTVRLGDRTLVQLTAAIRPGEILTIMAPSGAGKSTLLLALAGAPHGPLNSYCIQTPAIQHGNFQSKRLGA